MCDDNCGCGCNRCQQQSENTQTINASIDNENVEGGELHAIGPIEFVSESVFGTIDKLGGQLTPQLWSELGLAPIQSDDADLLSRAKENSKSRREKRTPEKEKAPCRRACRWIVTFSLTPSSVSESGDGTLNVSRHSWRELDGPGVKHHIWATTKGGNCFADEWSKTVIAAGQVMFRWRLACKVEDGSGPCPECEATGEVEAIYRCKCLTFTWEGGWCPIGGTRRSQGLSAQWAIFDVDGKRVFSDKAGAQSGDEVSTTIQATIGAEASVEDGKIGGKVSGSISSSQTRNEKSGEAKDHINVSGRKSIGASGHAVLRTGAKANLTTNSRAGGWVYSHTDSVGIYGILDSPCAKERAIFAWYAGVIDRDVSDTRRIMKDFFEHHNFKNHPFR